MSLKVIITGATGMVGEGVLHECLQDPAVETVLLISRKTSDITHIKIKEVLLQDFNNFDSIAEELDGYNACFHCMGVSSIGKKEEAYNFVTYQFSMSLAKTLEKINKDMCFCYVSGAGTDSTEKGSSMWARVKGRTENALLALFPNAYMYRPGYIRPTSGLQNTYTAYKLLDWLVYPVLRATAPGVTNTLAEIGRSMIRIAQKGHEKKILDPVDIRATGN